MEKEQFINDYIQESCDNFDLLNEICINLEKNQNPEQLKELLRILHTQKGNSRMLEFTKTEKILHSVESVFKNLSENRLQIEKKYILLLINLISEFKICIESISKNGEENYENFDSIIENLENAINGKDFSVSFKNSKIKTIENFITKDEIDSNQSIKIQLSDINSILFSFDKLIMNQIQLKNEINKLKKSADNSFINEFRQINEKLTVLENQCFSIQEKIIYLRMLPLSMILKPLKLSVSNEAIKLNKNVEFEIPYSEIKIDKTILEHLPQILIHLLRNSLDHGLETEEERIKLNKNPTGKISVLVTQNSSRIFITISDDGRGIDFEKIRKKALSLYSEREKEISQMNNESLLQFLFISGFSTKENVSEFSGRGIGLDVVRSEMDLLKGKISIKSEKNVGTSFELSLPLSLATQDGLFIQQGKNKYLILSHYIKEIVTIPEENFLTFTNNVFINLRGELLKVFDFDLITNQEFSKKIKKSEYSVIILEYLQQKIAVTVDQILFYQSIVIKPVPNLLKNVKGLQGVVFDENYKIIPILDIPFCINKFNNSTFYQQKKLKVEKTPKKYTILVVDDSSTTRNIEKVIFESENYNVITAVDGIDALEKMKNFDVDLVVTDISMPRMDGFVLLHNIRHTENLQNIPTIFVTSVYEKDTEQKLKDLGAQGYVVKSDFKRENLIYKVRELLNV